MSERESILTGRLVIVTGKGGTGKTTVAAALARAAALRGLRVMLAEVGRGEQAPALIRPGCGPVGYEGRELEPGLRAMRIDPFAALAEYLGLQLGRRIANLVVGNKGFRQLMGATPGWRELITLGKVWHLEQQWHDDAPEVDWIVVDAPATGHGLTFLDVPHVVASAIRSGPLRRHATAVEELLGDPDRCRLLPVALAEELPVRETHELVERLRGERAIRVDRIVVNAVEPPPVTGDARALPERLAALGDAPLPGSGTLPSLATLRACYEHRAARHALHREHLLDLEQRTGLPLVVLPYLAGGARGPDQLDRLIAPLLEEPRSVLAEEASA